IGIVYQVQSDYPHAHEYYFKALKIEEELGDKKRAANTNIGIGTVYRNQSDFPHALEYYKKALKLAGETGDKKALALVSYNIGDIYSEQGDYPHALEYDFSALKASEEAGDKQSIAGATMCIGSVYASQNNNPRALEYYFNALNIYKEIGDNLSLERTTGNIGNVYCNGIKDYPHALEYYLKALKIAVEMGDKEGAGISAGNIGNAYAGEKNYVLSIAFGKKALQMDEEIGSRRPATYALEGIGNAYLESTGDSVKDGKVTLPVGLPASFSIEIQSLPASNSARVRLAIDYLQRGLDSAKKIDILDVMKGCSESLAKAWKNEGDYKKAMAYYQDFVAIKDSIFSKENGKKILQLQMKYDYGKRDDSIGLANARKEKISALKLERQRNYTYVGIAGILALIIFSFFIVRERGKSERERKKSDDLLLNILPEEVANELKEKGITQARHFDNVTVLFTDFVNFTNAGEKMGAQELIDELHTCFKAFDEITSKYKIEKIKTIGDAYLAVAGLPLSDPEHAGHVVAAAIEINSFMSTRYDRLGDKTFQIRIGVHSGNVVAGIVGVKKFAYDIWGDTVNTAARMEQNSTPGRINISQTTYELVKDKFHCEYRGEIDAKNKGMLKMYFVTPPNAIA
ncbi:MAG: hypothetical protein JWQ38_2265, partial [Flavipsychrobacter sp.]|nr:hypothetical protein [Flavipsychrobacter sp.]